MQIGLKAIPWNTCPGTGSSVLSSEWQSGQSYWGKGTKWVTCLLQFCSNGYYSFFAWVCHMLSSVHSSPHSAEGKVDDTKRSRPSLPWRTYVIGWNKRKRKNGQERARTRWHGKWVSAPSSCSRWCLCPGVGTPASCQDSSVSVWEDSLPALIKLLLPVLQNRGLPPRISFVPFLLPSCFTFFWFFFPVISQFLKFDFIIMIVKHFLFKFLLI